MRIELHMIARKNTHRLQILSEDSHQYTAAVTPKRRDLPIRRNRITAWSHVRIRTCIRTYFHDVPEHRPSGWSGCSLSDDEKSVLTQGLGEKRTGPYAENIEAARKVSLTVRPLSSGVILPLCSADNENLSRSQFKNCEVRGRHIP